MAAILFTALPALAQNGNFIAPYSGTLYVQCTGGSAGGASVFGTGTTPANFAAYLMNLPESCPDAEVLVGPVTGGETLQFGILTAWEGQTYWAFSNDTDEASLVSFTDVCDDLGLNGSIYQPTGATTWVMHIDDAVHYPLGYGTCEANNMLVQLRFSPLNQQVPEISAGGVVPLDSTAGTIQSGEWVSIYGSNLASGAATWNNDFPISLDGTSVMIDGEAAYLWYVSPGQINLQVPDDTATGTVVVIVTTSKGSAASTVTLGQFAPSFLLLDAKHVTGIIIRTDGSGSKGGGTYDILGPTGDSLGYPTVAAKAGDVVELYGVGFGPTNPPVAAGEAFGGAAPTANTVQLMIGGVTVTPSFAGLSSAGLYQINLTIPPGLGTGDLPLVATVGSVQTQSFVAISVQ